jgi:ankyrin repeat protein
MRMLWQFHSEPDRQAWQAATRLNFQALREAIEDNGVNVNLMDGQGYSLLHRILISFERSTQTPDVLLSMVNFLLEKGASVDIQCPEGTALHVAVMQNNLEAVRGILKAGADLEVHNPNGKTPLDVAKEKHFQDIIALLEGAEVVLEANAAGMTALR